MKVMNVLITAAVLALSVSADALACGFGLGASRIKVPIVSAVAAAAVSAVTVAVGMSAAVFSAPFMPEKVGRYVFFGVLAAVGLVKLASRGDETHGGDCNFDRVLSVGEGVALGSALSIDGIAAGFGASASISTAVCASVMTFAVSAAALYLGARGGRGVKTSRLGNLAAGLTLIILAVQKLLAA